MHRLFALGLIIAAGLAQPEVAAREDQWSFKEVLRDGFRRPSAVFLSWDYGAVLFRAACDPETHELVVEYFGDGKVGLSTNQQMTLHRAITVPLRTRLVGARLEGRTKVTPNLLRVLSDAGELEIIAPNEMEEPWYVGRAEPLLRVAKLCR